MKRSYPISLPGTADRLPAQLDPQLRDLAGLAVYPQSQVRSGDALFFMARTPDAGRRLGILAPPDDPILTFFDGEVSPHAGQSLLVCDVTHANAAALQAALPWLQPRPLGLSTSAGLGDRLGLATPGHVRAAQAIARAGEPGPVGSARPIRHAAPAMIFAQQSIREMVRTSRTPVDVMADATWGIFQEGWQQGVGADADHLHRPEDIDSCLAAGYTFFTIDPGDHVDSAADADSPEVLRPRYQDLPWTDLDTSPDELLAAYTGRSYDLPGGPVVLDQPALVRAAVKYGRAIAHTARMYHHLAARAVPGTYEVEVSVDETETPTTHAEHIFVASELWRLGVRWVSLAPRYLGRFEKGVDYIGDLAAFERDFAGHAAIAQLLGPYKLSLHSGSDKFSIYGLAAQHARGLLHLKTAGTSYLEALRAVAGFDAQLFRDIFAFAVSRYETDRATYHVSADLARVPDIATVPDQDLWLLLDQFDARQVLHVTYGSVLTAPDDLNLRERLFAALRTYDEVYYDLLKSHFVRHLQPLAHISPEQGKREQDT